MFSFFSWLICRYDWWTGARLQGSTPGSIELAAPLDVINVHMKGGTVVPVQNYTCCGPITRPNDPYQVGRI